MQISSEKMQKYWADGFYLAGIDLLNDGKDEQGLRCLAVAYSAYRNLEDIEGMRKCRDNDYFRETMTEVDEENKSEGENLRDEIIDFGQKICRVTGGRIDIPGSIDESLIPEVLKQKCIEATLVSD